MKFLLLPVIITFGILNHAVETPNGCVNAACNYVEEHAAACQDAATGSLSGTDCLCTERFRVNLSRCLSGSVCSWDGNGEPTAPVCPEIYCPGTFDQSFVNECPGISVNPLPRPSGSSGMTMTSTTRSTVAPGATGTGPGSATTTGTITRSGTLAPAGASTSSTSTPNAGYMNGVSSPLVNGLAVLLGLVTVIQL